MRERKGGFEECSRDYKKEAVKEKKERNEKKRGQRGMRMK